MFVSWLGVGGSRTVYLYEQGPLSTYPQSMYVFMYVCMYDGCARVISIHGECIRLSPGIKNNVT